MEFDTWNNGDQWGNPGDPDGNHVAINVNGVLNDSIYSSITNAPMNDGKIWYVWIDYEGVSQDFEVRVSETPVRPLAPTLDAAVDLPAILGSTNAYVGFTGGTGNGWNQQDILSWKFMALPTTRFTGTFALTNLLPGFLIKSGLVLERYIYKVQNTTYTNYSYAPINITTNAHGQFAYATKLVELAPNALESALSNNAAAIDASDFMQFAMLASYTNSASPSAGAVINSYNDGTGYPEFLHNASFDNLFDMTEHSYETIVDQIANNPPPGLYPPEVLINNFIDRLVSILFGADEDGNYNSWTTTFSLGTEAGTMTAQQQVVYSPPLPSIILSPRSAGTNFVFDFVTVSNQSYSIWANPNLPTTNWVSYANLIGDGYIQKIIVPMTNSTRTFFRLSSP